MYKSVLETYNLTKSNFKKRQKANSILSMFRNYLQKNAYGELK